MAVSKKSISKGLFIAIIVAVIGFAGYFLGNQGTRSDKPYQALFLTNGQVYFGKIARQSTTHTILNDIYYLQVQQSIQPPPENQTQQPQVQLVKLGGELHKPKDEMVINNDHILFIEEIQNDGQVGQTIERHKRGETGTESTSTNQSQPTQSQ